MDIEKLLADSPSEETSNTKETVSQSKETVSEETVAETKETVKPKKTKKKPRGGNSPVIGDNGYNLEPGDNSRFLAISMQLMKMPKIDIRDEKQVEERLEEYFRIQYENDAKPTVAGMAMSLGVSRQTLWAIKTNSPTGGSGYEASLPPSVADLIKKAYFLMENLWEQYMLNGKVNPVTGIFLGKNNFGYQDKTEYVLTPNQQQDSDYSADEIRERYIAADQQKRLSDSQSDDTTND
jgi:hypothetical protein